MDNNEVSTQQNKDCRLNIECRASSSRTRVIIKIDGEKYTVNAGDTLELSLFPGDYNVSITTKRGGLTLGEDKTYTRTVRLFDPGQTERLLIDAGNTAVNIYDSYQIHLREENQPRSDEPLMTKKEFSKHVLVKGKINAVKGSGIAHFVYGTIHILLAFIVPSLNTSLDGKESMIGYILIGVLLIGLGAGIYFGKSRVCAVISLVIASLSSLIGAGVYGSLTGIPGVAFGIWATVATSIYWSTWKKYLAYGIID